MKRERERESGSEGGRLRGSVGPPQRERWLPSLKSSPASCPAPQLLPTLPQAAAGGSAIPAPAKAGKGGKGTGVRCTTGLPGPSTTRATTAATRPGAGRLRRPWVRALVRLEYPSSSGTWGEGPNRAQGCPPPPAFSFRRRWGGCLAATAGRLARTENQVHAPQACKAERATFGEGKWKSGSVESLSRGTRKEGGVGTGGGRKQNRCNE